MSLLPSVLTLACLLSEAPAESRRVAIVVGLSSYAAPTQSDEAGYSSLRYGHRDAQRVADRLRTLKWDVPVILTSEAERTATARKEAILSAIRSLRVDASDTLLFYFSGHGNRIGTDDYLAPYDAKFMRRGNNWDPNPQTLISTQELRDAFSRLPARKRIFILDACRDEAGSRAGTDGTVSIDKIGEAVSYVGDRRASACFLFSCDELSRSYEDPTLDERRGAGVFTDAFLKALSHPDARTAGGDLRPELVFDKTAELVNLWQGPQGQKMSPVKMVRAQEPISLGLEVRPPDPVVTPTFGQLNDRQRKAILGAIAAMAKQNPPSPRLNEDWDYERSKDELEKLCRNQIWKDVRVDSTYSTDFLGANWEAKIEGFGPMRCSIKIDPEFVRNSAEYSYQLASRQPIAGEGHSTAVLKAVCAFVEAQGFSTGRRNIEQSAVYRRGDLELYLEAGERDLLFRLTRSVSRKLYR